MFRLSIQVGCLLLWAMLGVSGCDRPQPPSGVVVDPGSQGLMAADTFPRRGGDIRFTDVTAESGLEMTVTSGVFPWTQIVEVKGGGLGLIDFDSDGLPDVFVPNGATMQSPERGPGCRLYRNLGSMRFEDVTQQAGLDFQGWGVGVDVADYDSDGHVDLYITCLGRNRLYRNRGDGRFEDVTEAAGVGDQRWGTGSAFGDIDGDGDLDLYVANYLTLDLSNLPPQEKFDELMVPTGPRSLPAQGDVLYENLGDGTFRDITESSGCGAVEAAYGLGVVILDFDGDERADIFVGNDSLANFFFINQGNGQFVDEGFKRGLATNGDGNPQATMGIGIGDIGGNGRPDVFTTNFAKDTNTLHLNVDGQRFVDMTYRLGVGTMSFAALAWACGVYDFNHDGSEDLVVFNGHIYPGVTLERHGSDFLQRPTLMVRDGLRFVVETPETAGPWLAESHTDRSAAFGDLDGDGDVDIIVSELSGPVRVLRNDVVDSPRWLIVQVGGQPLGTRVEVESDLPGTAGHMTRWIFDGGGFLSASEPVAHFGFASAVESVQVTVTWADGHRRVTEGVEPGQRVTVER